MNELCSACSRPRRSSRGSGALRIWARQVLVGQRVEVLQGAVVERAGLARVAGQLRLDAVVEARGHARRQRRVLLHQVARSPASRSAPEAAADVEERDAGQVAGRLVVVDDARRRCTSPLKLCRPVLGWLSTMTTASSSRQSMSSIGDQVDVEQIDHGPVLGPADVAVAGQAGGLAEAGFDQVGQADHAPEAVGVGVHVGDESDRLVTPTRPARKSIRSPGQSGLTAIHSGIGSVLRHMQCISGRFVLRPSMTGRVCARNRIVVRESVAAAAGRRATI